MKLNDMLIVFRIVHTSIQYAYSSEFSIGWSTFESALLISCEVVLFCYSSSHSLEMNSQFSKQENVILKMKSVELPQSCISQKNCYLKSMTTGFITPPQKKKLAIQ